jgi:hypothetical protein
MGKIELQLDKETFERVRRLAESRHCSMEQLIKEVIEELGVSEATIDPFLGMFAKEPELIDRVVESAMRAREEHPLRQSGG